MRAARLKDFDALLSDLKSKTRSRLEEATEVVDKAPPIDEDALAIAVPRWVRYRDVVAVSADLVGSTRLSDAGQWEKSTAAIFDASVGPMVETLAWFGADFIDVQGDGGFGLFAGEHSVERAVAAAISIATFSRRVLEKSLKKHWPDDGPRTGFRIGVAQSDLLAKKVGLPRSAHQEAVWAGRAVNYAVKVASQVGMHEVGITHQVAKVVRNNDYLYLSCGCVNGIPGTKYSELWSSKTFELLADKYAEGMTTSSTWCQNHGAEFCEQVTKGSRRRNETKPQRGVLTKQQRNLHE